MPQKQKQHQVLTMTNHKFEHYWQNVLSETISDLNASHILLSVRHHLRGRRPQHSTVTEIRTRDQSSIAVSRRSQMATRQEFYTTRNKPAIVHGGAVSFSDPALHCTASIRHSEVITSYAKPHNTLATASYRNDSPQQRQNSSPFGRRLVNDLRLARGQPLMEFGQSAQPPSTYTDHVDLLRQGWF